MQKRLLFVLFVIFFVWVFQGCNQAPIPPPERLPFFNSIQIEPNVKNCGRYTTIMGSYIQFLVNPVDSDRIDTGFSFLWKSECGGNFLDTLKHHPIPQDSVVKINVAQWFPETTGTGKIHITIYDSRDSSKDTLIDVSVLPYRYEGEIVDSSLQLPTGFGVSSDEIAILDAKGMVVNLYSKSNLTLTGSLMLPASIDSTGIENPVDVVFDDYDRMYISTANAIVRFVKNDSGKYVYDTKTDNNDLNSKGGRYFYYNNGKIYLTLNNGYNMFTIYDTTLTNILPAVQGEATLFRGSPKEGIVTDALGRKIYLLCADMDGKPYLRQYNENGGIVENNIFDDDTLPDSTVFYSIFRLNNFLYVCGTSPGWNGLYEMNSNIHNIISKWGAGGSSGPDRFSSIWDATARGDTFYLLDTGNKALKIFTYIH